MKGLKSNLISHSARSSHNVLLAQFHSDKIEHEFEIFRQSSAGCCYLININGVAIVQTCPLPSHAIALFTTVLSENILICCRYVQYHTINTSYIVSHLHKCPKAMLSAKNALSK